MLYAQSNYVYLSTNFSFSFSSNNKQIISDYYLEDAARVLRYVFTSFHIVNQ